MNITEIEIINYRGIKYAKFKPSSNTCIIGENNAGKSSILLALSLFFSGSSVSKSEFYDENEQIQISCTFQNFEEGDFNRLAPEHIERIKEIVIDNSIHLSRIYNIEGKSKIHCKRIGPKNQHLKPDVIENLLKGKKGAEVAQTLKQFIPERKEDFNGITSQKAGKDKINEIVAGLPEDEKELQISDLPTGIDTSIKSFLPEPIYIAAVKDLHDDVKTKETTTFGKLLGVLMKFLEGSNDFDEILKSFDKLELLLNAKEGQEDQRIEKLVLIERSIEKYLRENFPNTSVEIQVPKPELKQIFTNSKIYLDDGYKDTIDTKGDGIKRSLTFSLLRTYVDHLREQKQEKLSLEKGANGSLPQPYLFLFEEPELYLHPNAQKVLFNALESISCSDNQVFVTTHSPLFFSPDNTGSFIKVIKQYTADAKPYGKIIESAINEEMAYKDAFQILCYENNTPAFFANKVVLVEGDSDVIFLKETAKLLNINWNFDAKNISIIKTNGKSNIKRFKLFYTLFEVDVFTIADRDIFIDGFEKLDIDDSFIKRREKFLEQIDEVIVDKQLEPKISRDKIKEITNRYTWKDKYNRFKVLADKVKSGSGLNSDEMQEIEFLFAEDTNNVRRQVIDDPANKFSELEELIYDMYSQNVFILSKGAIENYYPNGTTGDDKPSKAINAIAALKKNKELLIELPKLSIKGKKLCELTEIYTRIFEP